MGYLLKEALKTLCGVNQWSYAVFWKIGCQNPRLLIWEDCYYEAGLCSAETSSSRSYAVAGDNAQMLMSKMMMDNHVNIVGEGLVGRVAFTGNYQWMLSDNYFIETHPPEVLRELGQQFAAGMQTVAVVPVLPHGVVQFGSYSKIMESMGFINDVMSLILQLGHVPGVLLSENYEKELAPRIGVPVLFGNPVPSDSSLQQNMIGTSLFDSLSYVKGSNPISMFGNLQSNAATFQTSNTGASHLRPSHFQHEDKMDSSDFSPPNILMNRVPKAEVIPSNCQIWTKQHASSSSASLNRGSMRCTEPQIIGGDGIQGHFSNSRMPSGISFNYHFGDAHVTLPSAEENGFCQNVMSSNIKPVSGANSVADAQVISCENHTPLRASSERKNVSLSKMVDSNPECVDVSSAISSVTYSWGSKNHDIEKKFPKSELGKNSKHDQHLHTPPLFPSVVEDEMKGKACPAVSSDRDDSCVQPQSGDDLFDVLGADFKNKLFSSSWNSSSGNEFAADAYTWDGGFFPSSCSDNLLEAVVSTVHPSAKRNLDDDVSCKTTLTHTSCSSASPMASLPLSRLGVSELVRGESLTVSKYPEKAGALSSNSVRTGFTKEDSGSFSQSSSIYASQMSSWAGKGQNTKQSNSGSNGYSRNTDQTGKSNRKRLKPGENPRPRPKDRQMIQDRVKELREIVPNGAKCSIDALLERTIKHMLFLHSVSKHGDKLKQIGESKVISKDGGLVPKEDFKGGATWAYEVGSQSVLCPIIVEDLNQPRQMLIEMFFEERGLFLEIADIIRGLGLTILKGVMETRNDKIWARFIVEANRDVTRMEIFLALVRLLEQTAKPGASQPNTTSSENMMVPQLQQSAAG